MYGGRIPCSMKKQFYFLCPQVNITDMAKLAESMAFAQQAEMNYAA